MAPEDQDGSSPQRSPVGFGDRGSEGDPRPHRAGPPRATALTGKLLQAEKERANEQRGREVLERHSVLRGLILLAILLLLVSLVHAGAGRGFPAGWWQRW